MSELPLAGLTVVVTGNVPGLSRGQATDAVTTLGGKPMTSVSSRTGLVVMGEGAGLSKTAKVRQHDVKVLAADVFAALAADPSAWDGQPLGVHLDNLALASDAAAAPSAPPAVAWSERAHAVGLATAPAPDGATEYRCWCRCGLRWLGAPGDMIAHGCPGETGTRAHARWGQDVTADSSRALASRWGMRTQPEA